MPDLKPCPFCGGTKLKIDRKSKRAGWTGLDDRVEQHTYSVRCNTCHARGGAVGGKVIPHWGFFREREGFELPSWATDDKALEEKAIEAWNRRAGGGDDMKENCAECRHHDVFWGSSGCNLLNNGERCKFEPRQKPAEEDDHEMEEAHKMAISALRQQETVTDRHELNGPLTLDELRKMDGEPVWVEFQDGSGGKWGLVHITMFNQIVFANGLHCTIGEPYYGKTWLAYRQKPEEGTV